jgi:hypothetical protein
MRVVAGFHVVSARELIRDELRRTDYTRNDLIAAGALLEKRTRGEWLASAVRNAMLDHKNVVVDSARSAMQLRLLQKLARDAQIERFLILYISASEPIRKARFLRHRTAKSRSTFVDVGSWNKLSREPIERRTKALRGLAHMLVVTRGTSL